MAAKASRLDPSNWVPASSSGAKVNLFSVLGFTQPAPYPQLQPTLVSGYSQQKSQQSATPSGGSTTLSGQLTYAQLEQLWVQAGGNPAYQAIAAAVAMAESGGQQYATDNDSNGTVDRGYWQINSSHGSQSTFDPLGNARAAISISANGTNWNPWTTYTSGAYLKYLNGQSSTAMTGTSPSIPGAST